MVFSPTVQICGSSFFHVSCRSFCLRLRPQFSMRSAGGHVKTEKEVTPLPIRRQRLADRRSFSSPALYPLMDEPFNDFEAGDDRPAPCRSKTEAALCHH